MLTRLKAVVITILGVPVMAAIVVGAPIIWWDARQNFGLAPMDNLGFIINAAFASIVLVIAARAYWRVVVKKEGESDFPPILIRLVPFQFAVGVGLALFVAHGIHEQRTGNYTYFAQKHCARILCPVPEGELLFADDCAAPGLDRCLEVAWACQKAHAGTPFETRDKAEARCIRDRLKVPAP